MRARDREKKRNNEIESERDGKGGKVGDREIDGQKEEDIV